MKQTLFSLNYVNVKNVVTIDKKFKMYKPLSFISITVKPTYIQGWVRDLGLKFSEEQFSHLYQFTHSRSIDSKIQETNYKILMLWCRVPTALLHINP